MLLPNTYLEEPLQASGRPPVELAYAATLHAAQGATVDKALYVVRGGEGAEAQYVGMSRGRHTNTAVALTRSRVSDPTIGQGATVGDLADTMRHAARSPTVSGVTLSDETAGRTSPPDPTPEPEPAQPERDPLDETWEQVEEAAQKRAAEEAEDRKLRAELNRQLAKAEAERKAAIATAVQQWAQGLPDELSTDQVAADADQQWWGPDVDAPAAADAYRSVQKRAAIRWVQSVWAGYPAGWVADAAGERFAVGDDPGRRLEEAYQAADEQRIAAGDGWLDEHGSRRDDDQQEDSRAEAVAKFEIIPEYADKMVDAYDTRQRATVVASVEDLTKNRSAVQALPEIVEQWVNTRYLDDALAALQQAQEQETQQRGRGGPSLDW